MRTLYRTFSIVMVIFSTLITNWSVHNIDGLLDRHHLVAAFAALSVAYLALNFEESLPPASSVARVAIVLLGLFAIERWYNGASTWAVILVVIWASTLIFSYDIVADWWQRLWSNRRARKERKRQTRQSRKNSHEGLSIFDEPQPVA